VVLSWQALVEVTGEEPSLPSSSPTPEAVLLHREREAYLRDAVAALPERLHGVIQRLYFEDATLSEVAAELDVTESRVSQMRTEAMSLLRDAMHANLSPTSWRPRRCRTVASPAARPPTTPPSPAARAGRPGSPPRSRPLPA
jgi:RNA polymerase sigma factor for flagellar operon FliA